MKILHLLQSNRFSGAENVVCQIIGMMKNESNMEFVYCSRNGQIAEELNRRNIRFAPISDLTVKEVKKVIKEERPDIIHAHDMRASFIAAMSCGTIPIISHIHNSDFMSRKISAKSVAYLLSTLKISHIIWVSDSCLKNYVFYRKLLKKSTVLYNVINSNEIKSKVQQDPNVYEHDVVFIGRLADPKNPVRLIKIIELVKQRYEDVKVGIVGTGDLENVTRHTSHECGLDDNIVFYGFSSNPMKILNDSKVMVMTSDREGTPMVALEAMALGVPIVSTPTDGLCEIVRQGETGFLESDNHAFADRIIEIISNVEIRNRLSQNSFRRFSELNDIEKYKDVLNGCYRKK